MAPSDVTRDYLGCSADAFALIGVACTACFGFKALSSIFQGIKAYFLARTLGLTAKLERFGQWAVITGSTDGIGKAYAEQLLVDFQRLTAVILLELDRGLGLNVVLISRSLEKLRNVAKEIETKFKVKTKIIAADFSQGTSIYAGIQAELEGLEIGVLVNNVGMSYSYPGRLLDFDNREKLFVDLIHLNVTSMTLMTNMVLPGMVARKKGAVINLSSLAGSVPVPMMTVYSAVKAFADFFSRGLAAEYSDQGIIVQSVLPGFVVSNMSKIRRPNLMTPMPSSFVRSALATVGVQSRTQGVWQHALMGLYMRSIPSWIYNKTAIYAMELAKVKYLKKLAREAKAQ